MGLEMLLKGSRRPASINPFRFCREAKGNLDRDTSSEERYVFELMSKLLEKHKKIIASHSLKLILHWAQSHIKRLNASTAFTVEL